MPSATAAALLLATASDRTTHAPAYKWAQWLAGATEKCLCVCVCVCVCLYVCLGVLVWLCVLVWRYVYGV